jgi:hypothetical protein
MNERTVCVTTVRLMVVQNFFCLMLLVFRE